MTESDHQMTVLMKVPWVGHYRAYSPAQLAASSQQQCLNRWRSRIHKRLCWRQTAAYCLYLNAHLSIASNYKMKENICLCLPVYIQHTYVLLFFVLLFLMYLKSLNVVWYQPVWWGQYVIVTFLFEWQTHSHLLVPHQWRFFLFMTLPWFASHCHCLMLYNTVSSTSLNAISHHVVSHLPLPRSIVYWKDNQFLFRLSKYFWEYRSEE